MSYTIDLFLLRKPAEGVDDIREKNWLEIGDVDEVRRVINGQLPGTTWESESTGLVMGTLKIDGQWWCRISFDAPVVMITVEMSYGVPDKHGFVQRICNATGWTGLDTHKGVAPIIVPRRREPR